MEADIQNFQDDIEGTDLTKPEMRFEFPRIEYEESDGAGFGLDGAVGEHQYNTKLGEKKNLE